MSTENKNEKIAKFMGKENLRESRPDIIKTDMWTDGVYEIKRDWHELDYHRSPLDPAYGVHDNLHYDHNWNWLMPVIKKLSELDLPIDSQKWFTLYAYMVSGKIQDAFQWVCDIIHQYNCQPK